MLAKTIGLNAGDLSDDATPLSWRAASMAWLGLALLGWVPLAAVGAALL